MELFRVHGAVSTLVVLLLAAGLAGCSGSSGSTSAGPESPPAQPDAPSDPNPPEDPDAPDDPETPTGAPNVDFTAAETVVDSGDSVQLSWSSENVSQCSASGGWSGPRDVRGSATVGPLDRSTTYSLTCSGAAGNAVAMLSVSVLGVVSLSWQAPSENEDGSPLTDLSGYRIYYGTDSRSYTDEVAVTAPATTVHNLVLASGSYYFAMTALDGDGNESAYSNEVVRVVN